MLITITGNLGSGKSTLCNILSKRYQFEIYSTGLIHRNLAQKMGLDTIALNQLMKKEQHYDRMIDDEVIKISKAKKNARIIFDSRLAWHFVEQSFKIFATIDPYIAAKRVLASPRYAEEKYLNTEDAMTKLQIRAKLESERFKTIYNINYLDYKNYNIILDTTWLDPETLSSLIYDEYINTNIEITGKILISPKSLYPTKALGGTSDCPDPVDCFREHPLEVICQNGYHYVVEGHGSLLAALKANLPYVHAVLSKHRRLEEIGLPGPNLVSMAEAEKAGGFVYASLPEATNANS
jgi:cytidylate kinase